MEKITLERKHDFNPASLKKSTKRLLPSQASQKKKEGTKGNEDYCVRTHGLEQRMITLTVVAQNGLGISSAHFDTLLKEMTEHQVQAVRALKDHEHVEKKDSEKAQQGRKEAAPKLIS